MDGSERRGPSADAAAFAVDHDTAIALLADAQVRRAIARGDFDDLAGAGHAIDLSHAHDPNWWFASLAKREGFAVLPLSLQLRREDAALDEALDRLATEAEVRQEVGEFNRRVIRARYEPPAGPPLVTMPRDADEAVAAWAERRAHRREAAEAAARERDAARRPARRRRAERRDS